MAHDSRGTFGIDTFGDVTVDGEGRRLSDAEVLRNVTLYPRKLRPLASRPGEGPRSHRRLNYERSERRAIGLAARDDGEARERSERRRWPEAEACAGKLQR